MSTSTEYMDGLNAPAERRFYARVTPPTPIYVAFGSNNLGVLHNVSENGLQVKTPGGLPLNSVFRVFLSLNGAPKTITVTVRTVWTDEADKRSGIQLLDLADEDRAQIRRWVEFELSRGESATGGRRPENGDRRVPKLDPGDRAPVAPVAGRQDFGAFGASVVPPAAAAPSVDSETPYNRPLSNAEQRRSGRRFNGAFVPKDRVASEPLPEEVAAVAAAASDGPEPNEYPSKGAVLGSQAADRTPSASIPPPPAPAAEAPSIPPAEVSEAELPKIANPFDHPDPNAQFNSPFAKVPLPIHGEFEYASQPSKQRRRPSVSSRLRAKPLIIWAAVLAVVCFGANALVRYKIKLNARHYAEESAKYAAPNSDATTPNSTTPADDSGANAANSSPTDSQSAVNPNADAAAKDQANSPTTSGAATTTTARDASSATGTTAASKPAPRRESSLDERTDGAYSATAPPSSDRSQYTAAASQPVPTPRSWNAPAPNHSASSGLSSSDTPPSPNVTSSSDNAAAQSAPIVSQAHPTPPPTPAAQPQSTNNAASATASNSNNGASNPPARTQQQASATQTQTYASNTPPANTTPSRPQSQIYNANTPQQRSAIMSSIDSVHSSGIFDSNDRTTANAAPPAASRANNGSANVATRGAANSAVVPTDTPQERDIEIPAPKGFKDSYVEVPGEHVVRTTTATVRMHRLVRVPGERIPGQRWLWRGKLNVTLGEVINRIDPSVVQASGASGSLTVQATIDKDGYVTDLKPLYGNFAMLPSVSRAVRNWHYEPTYLDSKRAETQAQIEFDLRPTAANTRTQR